MKEPVFGIEDRFPMRVDLRSQITENLLSELEDKNWRVRMKALTKFNQILQCHEANSIKPNLGDLPQALPRRLADKSKHVAKAALKVCKSIAIALGARSKQYLKTLFPLFLRHLGDPDPEVHGMAKQTIHIYIAQDLDAYKEIFKNEMISLGLKTANPQLKTELWMWLSDLLPKDIVPAKSIPKEELVLCIPLLYRDLEARASDIRSTAQKAILGLMIHVGYHEMAQRLESLKAESQPEIKKKLDNERKNLLAERGGTKSLAKAKNDAVKSKEGARTTDPIKEEPIEKSPLLVVNTMKQERMELQILKWNFTTPGKKFFSFLRMQMAVAGVNNNLIANMFHTDPEYHMKALDALMDDLSDNSDALIANLDLILKWLALCFFDTNPSVVCKTMEYLQSVFAMLVQKNYKILEDEMTSFLPYLMMKIGDEQFCDGVLTVIKQICLVYPPERMLSFVMEDLKAKNRLMTAKYLKVILSILQNCGKTNIRCRYNLSFSIST